MTSNEKTVIPATKDLTGERGVEGAGSQDGPAPVLVVTNILLHRGKVLLLKRSQQVETFRGHWAGCSGHIEHDETVEQASYKEIREETGLERSSLKLLAWGKAVLIEKPHGAWLVHPFLYATDCDKVTLDWEHVEYRWVRPEEVEEFDTVPGLSRVILELLDFRQTSQNG